MRNKKWLSILLTFVLTLSLVACGNSVEEDEEKEEKPQKTLYEQGMDVVSLMVEATRNETYIEIYTTSEDMLEILEEIGEGDFAEPNKVLSITGDTKFFGELLGLNEIDGLSRDLEENLNNRMFGALITQLNSRAGVNYLAASSVCTMGKTFVNDDVRDNIMYIYMYEDATPIAVTFIPGEDGAVSASGCFIMAVDVKEEVDEMEEVFEELGMEVEEVEFE